MSDTSSASSGPALPVPSASSPLQPTGAPRVTSTVTGSKTPGQQTLQGDVARGVEPGCVLLNATDGKAYLLVGGDRTVIGAGGRLEVVGHLEPGLMTTCQQGTPFQVDQVRRI